MACHGLPWHDMENRDISYGLLIVIVWLGPIRIIPIGPSVGRPNLIGNSDAALRCLVRGLFCIPVLCLSKGLWPKRVVDGSGNRHMHIHRCLHRHILAQTHFSLAYLTHNGETRNQGLDWCKRGPDTLVQVRPDTLAQVSPDTLVQVPCGFRLVSGSPPCFLHAIW